MKIIQKRLLAVMLCIIVLLTNGLIPLKSNAVCAHDWRDWNCYSSKHPHPKQLICSICREYKDVPNTQNIVWEDKGAYSSTHPHQDLLSCKYCDTYLPVSNTENVAWSYQATYESEHPHYKQDICVTQVKGYNCGQTRRSSGNIQTLSYGTTQYEPTHPHNSYQICNVGIPGFGFNCGHRNYTGTTRNDSSCSVCNPPPQPPPTPVPTLNITTLPEVIRITKVSDKFSVTIRWYTNISSDAFVYYGTTSQYGSVASNTSMTTNHEVTISGLSEGIYYYKIKSGNLEKNNNFAFATKDIYEYNGVLDNNDTFDNAYLLSGFGTIEANLHSHEGILDDFDYYKISVSTGTLNISLNNIPADSDYDVYLYDQNEHIVTGVANETDSSETLSASVNAGQYYIFVASGSSKGQPYNNYKLSTSFDYPYIPSYVVSETHYGESGSNSATGNFSRTYTDFKLPAAAFNMDISRTYNSRDIRSSNILSKGWTFNFESSVKPCTAKQVWSNGSITTYTNSNLMEVRLPGEAPHFFSKNADGSFTAKDSRYKLTGNDGAFVLSTKDQVQYNFNSSNFLSSIQDRYGNKLTIEYSDTSGRISKIIDVTGRTLTLDYETKADGVKGVKTVKDSGQNDKIVVSYFYNNKGQLEKSVDAAGNTTFYSYDAAGLLNQVRDSNNNEIESMVYYTNGSDNGKIEAHKDRLGGFYKYVYDEAAAKTTIIDQNDISRRRIEQYDSQKNIVSVLDEEGKEIKTQYNEFGEKKSYTDRNGNTYVYEIDENNGNIKKITNPDLSTKEMDYDEKNNLIYEKNEEGKKTFYVYDIEKKKLLMKLQPLDPNDHYQNGITLDLSKYQVTKYDYYTDAEASTNGFVVKGLIKSTTDPLNNTTTYTYYSNYGAESQLTGLLKDEILPRSTIQMPIKIEHHFNSYRVEDWECTAEGYKTERIYDAMGNALKVIQNNGNGSSRPITKKSITRTYYDYLGRKIKEISPNLYDELYDVDNNYTKDVGYRYEYDDLTGLLKEERDPLNYLTTYTYDVYGNLKTETKPNNSVYEYEYDKLNRIIKKSFRKHPDDIQVILEEYNYEILPDKKTSVTFKRYTDINVFDTTKYVYDYAGKLLTQENPDGTKVENLYYYDGKLKSSTVTPNGKSVYYEYDKYDSGNNLKYNESWTLESDFDGNEKYSYIRTEFDKMGRKTAEKTGRDYTNLKEPCLDFQTRNYIYTWDGNIEEEWLNNIKKSYNQYDLDGKLIREEIFTDNHSSNLTEYRYNYLGKLDFKAQTVKKGDLYGNSYEDNSLATITTNYDYYPDGNIYEEAKGGVTTTYFYDDMGRVIKTCVPGLDEFGNNVTIEKSSTYNWEGKIDTQTDARGNITRYKYDERGFLTKVETDYTLRYEIKKNIILYGYDLAGRKTTEVLPENYKDNAQLIDMNRYVYTYDSMDRLKTKEYFGEEKTYNGGWNIQSVNYVINGYKYDSNGKVIKELDSRGYVLGGVDSGYGTEYTYSRSGKILSILDPEAKAKGSLYTKKYEYSFDHTSNLRKVTETTSKSIKNSYYDDSGNLIKITMKKDPSDVERDLQINTYDLIGNLLTTKDGNGNITTYYYNALNKLKKVVYPGDKRDGYILISNPEDAYINANTVIYQYDPLSNKKYEKQTNGRIDLYSYDNQGRLLSHTTKDESGNNSITTSAKYDKDGNKRFETDGNQNTWEYQYDELNRMISKKIDVTDVNNYTTVHITMYDYDGFGNITTEEHWNGNKFTYSYDAFGRLIEKYVEKQEYQSGQFSNICVWKNEYDRCGNNIASYDAYNNKTTYKYDKLNRLIETLDPLEHKTSSTYDLAGNMDSETDGRGKTTRYIYNELGKIEKVINAKDEETIYTYDMNGNMLTQKDFRGKITTYEYNAMNKPSKKIYHGGRTENQGKYSYDWKKVETFNYYADGSLKDKKDRNGSTTNYIYDIHGRLIKMLVEIPKILSPLGSGSTLIKIGEFDIISTSFTYDGNGNRLTMSDSTGTTAWTYDQLNRETTKSVPGLGIAKTIYDIKVEPTQGFLAETTVDPKGNKTTKVFDRAGKLVNVKDGDISSTISTRIAYDNNGRKTDVFYPGGAWEQYIYYTDGMLEKLINYRNNGLILETFEYTYDDSHNIQTKKDSRGTTSYVYDALNRLEKITEPHVKVTEYTYDGSGNRDTETITFQSSITKNSYCYDDYNRLESITVNIDGTDKEIQNFGYDYNGNLIRTEKGHATSRQITLYVYDGQNQLVKAISQGKASTYTYNGDGQRVEKNSEGIITKSFYKDDKVILETDNAGNETGRNLYGTNLLARTVNGQTLYYMYNGHGDVTALLDSEGKLKETYYYDAFGNLMPTLYGDVNCDGKVTLDDSNYLREYNAQRITTFIRPEGEIAADVDGDKELDGVDYVLIRDYALEITNNFAADKNLDGYVNEANNSNTYASYAFDKETGLYYLNSRMYDPITARFLQEDTDTGSVDDPLSLNLYTYCHNEPLMYSDPDGHREKIDDLVVFDDPLTTSVFQNEIDRLDGEISALEAKRDSISDPNGKASIDVSITSRKEEQDQLRARYGIDCNNNVVYMKKKFGIDLRYNNAGFSSTKTIYKLFNYFPIVDAFIPNSDFLKIMRSAYPNPEAMKIRRQMVGGRYEKNLGGKLKDTGMTYYESAVDLLNKQFSGWKGEKIFENPYEIFQCRKEHDYSYEELAMEIALGMRELNKYFYDPNPNAKFVYAALTGDFNMFDRSMREDYNKVEDYINSAELLSQYENLPCFTKNTIIKTETGDKRICEIKVGDKVYSNNPEEGKKGLRTVKEVFRKTSDYLVHISVDGENIETTLFHPFWVQGKGWTAAKDIKNGDYLIDYEGKKSYAVENVIIEKLKKPVEVYNFEVEDLHAYCITQIGFVVHNMCAPDVSGNLVVIDGKYNVTIKPIQRTGPKGVDPKHHNLNVMVKSKNGTVKSHQRYVSGYMTQEEKDMGFPKGQNASHTEARYVRNDGHNLESGDTVTMVGQKKPCNSCKGYMNRLGRAKSVNIIYKWRQNGITNMWKAKNK